VGADDLAQKIKGGTMDFDVALATLAEDPAWAPLCQGLLAPAVAARPPGPADRVQYPHAWQSARRTL